MSDFDKEFDRFQEAEKRTLRYQAEEFRAAWENLGHELLKAVRPLFCAVGLHQFSVAHPHYCGACGRHYGLR